MNILFTASAHGKGGRNGEVENENGNLKFSLAIPKSLGGTLDKPNSTNPEELFACGYAACFGSAIDFVARKQKIVLNDIQVKSFVSLGPKPEGGFALAAELHIYLPELSLDQAKEIVAAADRTCPYSNAMRNNVQVTLKVVDEI